jgi:hypothetical protein
MTPLTKNFSKSPATDSESWWAVSMTPLIAEIFTKFA